MLACTDTFYGDFGSRTSLVLFEQWNDDVPTCETVTENTFNPAEYVPGQFFRRELPCILSATRSVGDTLSTLVIDGYVWLDNNGRKGLGAFLYDALDQAINVIGVAKTRFAGSHGVEVFRGTSRNPLIVTAAGLSPI